MATEPLGTPSKVSKRWTARLGTRFCVVSSYFLGNYHRLKAGPGEPGLSSTEAMVVIHVMDFKWDEKHPFPTVGTLATRMGVSVRHVRDTLKALQDRGYLTRIPGARGGANRYDLDGLFKALETLMDADADAEQGERTAAA